MALPPNAKAVNLGCGITIAPGWINIDNSPNARLSKYPRLRWLLWKLGLLSDRHYEVEWPESISIHNLKNRLPFASSSVDYVYSSHVLEHLSLTDAQKVTREVARVLKPGGILRVIVPDLALGARRYLNALEANPSDQKAAPEFLGWLQLSKLGVRDPHLWMYDAPSLSVMLTESGLSGVRICEYRQGLVPDCDILDTRPDESLYIEAAKV
jgi:predicted SAM-dependent methyltransferase